MGIHNSETIVTIQELRAAGRAVAKNGGLQGTPAYVANTVFEYAVENHYHEEGHHTSIRSYDADLYDATSQDRALSIIDRVDDTFHTAMVIPIYAESDVKRSTKITAVEITPEQNSMHDWELIAELSRSHGIDPTSQIESRPKMSAPRAAATEGSIVTRYFLANGRGDRLSQLGTFDTMADARAEGIEHLKHNPAIGELNVRSEQIRIGKNGDTNNNLVSIILPAKGGKAKIKTIVERYSANAKIVGYVVGYSYHA